MLSSFIGLHSFEIHVENKTKTDCYVALVAIGNGRFCSNKMLLSTGFYGMLQVVTNQPFIQLSSKEYVFENQARVGFFLQIQDLKTKSIYEELDITQHNGARFSIKEGIISIARPGLRELIKFRYKQ